MRGSKSKFHPTWKGIAQLMAVVVYVAMISYSTYHNIMLMTKGVKGDAAIFAWLGIIALEVTALFLPLSLKFWTHDPTHKVVAYIFYVLNLALVILNVILNFNTQAGQPLPGWMQDYLHVFVPVTPIVCGLGWAFLLLLDPEEQVRSQKAENDLNDRLLYEQAKARYSSEDADYRAMIESKAMRDQLAEAQRRFGISTVEEVRPGFLFGPAQEQRNQRPGLSQSSPSSSTMPSKNGIALPLTKNGQAADGSND